MKKPFLRKISEIEDRATGNYYHLYRFRKMDGKAGTLQILAADAHERRVIKKLLLNAGANLGAEAASLIDDAATSTPTEIAIYAARTGWLSDYKGYALPNGCIGKPTENIKGVRIPHGAELSRKGSSKRWSQTVGSLTKDSSYMMTAICAAFSAPLLNVAGCKSFALCFSGPSRTGKTVTITAAASVIGCKGSDELLSWNLTDAHLEERLTGYNDCLMPIDDLEIIPGLKAERYTRVRDLAYLVAHGRAKGRSINYEKNDRNKNWRVILLTSSETTVHSLARAAKQNRSNGEWVRLIDIPVLSEQSGHIFDRRPQATEDWTEQRLKAIAEACQENYGFVFRRYVKQLIALGGKRNRYVKARSDFFADKAVKQADGRLARDLARKFALLYAGGCLAIKFKLVPWSKAELLRAIEVSYLAAKSILPDERDPLTRGKEVLYKYLNTMPSEEEFLRSKKTPSGYRRLRDRNAFLIRCEEFNKIFESDQQQRSVMSWLRKSGQITLSKVEDGSKSERIQFTWADGERRRSYEIVQSRQERVLNLRNSISTRGVALTGHETYKRQARLTSATG